MLPTPPTSNGLAKTIKAASTVAANQGSKTVRASHVLLALTAALGKIPGDRLAEVSLPDPELKLTSLIGRAVQHARNMESTELTDAHLLLAILDDFDSKGSHDDIQAMRQHARQMLPTPTFPPSDAFARFSDHPEITPLSDSIDESQTAIEDCIGGGDYDSAAHHRNTKNQHVRRLYTKLEELWHGECTDQQQNK